MNTKQSNTPPVKIDVKSLKIMLMTNLEESDEKEYGIPFTSQVLYNPELKMGSKMNLYPSLCISHLYPRERFTKYTYDQRVRLFFQPNRLKQKMEEWNQKNPLVSIPSRTDNSKKWNNMVYQNIFTMLEILFPTSLPIKNNVHDTYLDLVPNKQLDPDEKMNSTGLFDMQKIKRDISQLIGGPMPYSYLRLNGKIYTITRAYWLNDIFNHPIYKELAMEFEEFKKWKGEMKDRIEKEKIEVKKEELRRLKPLSILFFEYQSDKNKTRIDELNNSITAVPTQTSAAEKQRIIDLKDQNEILQSIMQKIRDINEYIEKTYDINIVNTVNDLNNQINTMKTRYSLVVPESNTNEIRILSQIAKSIEQYQSLKILYFGNIINIDIDNKENPSIQLLNSEFSKYVDFVDMLKRFVYPTRQSTNNELYRLISEYLQKKNQYLEFIMDEIYSYSGKLEWKDIDLTIQKRIDETKEQERDRIATNNKTKFDNLLTKFEKIYNDIIAEANKAGLKADLNSSICKYGTSSSQFNEKLCSDASTVDFNLIKQNIVMSIDENDFGIQHLIKIIEKFNEKLKQLGAKKNLLPQTERLYKKFLADVQNLLLQVKEFEESLYSQKTSIRVSDPVNIQSILKTNLDIVSDKSANFEMYLDVSLIGGELNNSNYGKIKCLYKGEHLNELYIRLKYPKTYKTWVLAKEPFYDLGAQLKKIPEKEGITTGGKRKTHRILNKYLNKTRKIKK
jgi:hypothetical protein